MAVNNFKRNHLMALHFKGLIAGSGTAEVLERPHLQIDLQCGELTMNSVQSMPDIT